MLSCAASWLPGDITAPDTVITFEDRKQVEEVRAEWQSFFFFLGSKNIFPIVPAPPRRFLSQTFGQNWVFSYPAFKVCWQNKFLRFSSSLVYSRWRTNRQGMLWSYTTNSICYSMDTGQREKKNVILAFHLSEHFHQLSGWWYKDFF